MMRAAVKVQTAYRLLRLIYLRFGPTIFCKCTGNPAPYGTLRFTRGIGQQHDASFICLAQNSKMTLLCHFVERFWRLQAPDVVIDVTGSTRDLLLDSRIAQSIADGLDTVLRTTSCWMMTGAFDAGLSQLVGQAVRISGVNAPVIGVGTWSAVKGRNALQLDGCQGETVTYNSVELAQLTKGKGLDQDQETALYLNGDCTHFILVDTPESSQLYGHGPAAAPVATDSALRARFVDAYTDRKHLAVVTLVVQGDMATLDGVLAAARGKTPIICVTGSGGCADAILGVVYGKASENDTADREAMPRRMSIGGDAFKNVFKTAAARKKLNELVALHEANDRQLITAFDCLNDEEASLSTAMLEAIVRIQCQGLYGAPSSVSPDQAGELNVDAMANSLKLAINWDRPEIVHSLVGSKMLNDVCMAAPPKSDGTLSHALTACFSFCLHSHACVYRKIRAKCSRGRCSVLWRGNGMQW